MCDPRVRNRPLRYRLAARLCWWVEYRRLIRREYGLFWSTTCGDPWRRAREETAAHIRRKPVVWAW